MIVVTCSWSLGPIPLPRSAPVARVSTGARHWQSILTDDSEPDEPMWTHLFVERFDLAEPRLEQLLRLVADFVTAGVLITDSEMRWIYHPYDGGADVFPATSADRDSLRAEHADWLSALPSGFCPAERPAADPTRP